MDFVTIVFTMPVFVTPLGTDAVRQLLEQLTQLQSLLLYQYSGMRAVATAHLTQNEDKVNKSNK